METVEFLLCPWSAQGAERHSPDCHILSAQTRVLRLLQAWLSPWGPSCRTPEQVTVGTGTPATCRVGGGRLQAAPVTLPTPCLFFPLHRQRTEGDQCGIHENGGKCFLHPWELWGKILKAAARPQLSGRDRWGMGWRPDVPPQEGSWHTPAAPQHLPSWSGPPAAHIPLASLSGQEQALWVTTWVSPSESLQEEQTLVRAWQCPL